MRMALLVVICLLGVGCASQSNQQSDPTQFLQISPASRQAMLGPARAAVEAQLAAPSTAKFCADDEFSTDMVYHPSRGFTEARVGGYVDASNYYGAMLRKQFFVTWQEPGRANTDNYRPSLSAVMEAKAGIFP